MRTQRSVCDREEREEIGHPLFLTLINKNNSIIMLIPDLFVISHVIISQMDSVLWRNCDLLSDAKSSNHFFKQVSVIHCSDPLATETSGYYGAEKILASWSAECERHRLMLTGSGAFAVSVFNQYNLYQSGEREGRELAKRYSVRCALLDPVLYAFCGS